MFPVGQQRIGRYLFFHLIVLFVLLIVLHIIVGYSIIRQLFIRDVHTSVQTFVERVKNDFAFDGNTWNTTKYLADPQTPHPNGSSGYVMPLYIISTDGFVIERTNPISGLLDSSDFQKLRKFTAPVNVSGNTNEEWRVVSREIPGATAPAGIIVVAMYDPAHKNIKMTDEQLLKNSDLLMEKIRILPDGSLDVTGIDIRNIRYDVSFEIVNTYNRVVLNNGRTPSFIDASYIEKEMKNHVQFIRDSKTNELFFVHTDTIRNPDGVIKGIIVAADSLQDMEFILRNFLLISLFLGVGIAIPISFGFSLIGKQWVKMNISHEAGELEKLSQKIPERVWFDAKQSLLHVDGDTFQIPYATNQYYLCDALFLHPAKRWETDELVERIGGVSSSGNIRSLYDASLALNRKFGWKLVVYQDKTYRLNPELIGSLKK